jgi:ribosome-associated protein
LTTKKRAEGEAGARAPTRKRTKPASEAGEGGGAKPRPASSAKRPARRGSAGLGTKPRIRASHGSVAPGPSPRPGRARLPVDKGTPRIKPKGPSTLRKAPLAPPKRTGPARPRPAAEVEHGPSSEARELALALAAAAIDKKALGIEILDVTGKIDYADFLVVMTGRSDRHVHAIATGIEEAMRKKKHAPLSMEGLSAATWVLMDFGDVVVHVFQEESRAVYDIEGLWIDAGRVPVPAHEGSEGKRGPMAETPVQPGD